MKKLATLTTIAALSLIASGAFAATQIQGVDAFITGDNAGIGNFAPTSGLQVLDDGVAPDAALDDDVFTAEWATPPASTAINYKLASDGFSPVNAPSGPNLYGVTPATGPVTFFVELTVDEPGFLPEAGTGDHTDGLVWSTMTRPYVDAATTVSITGNFQDDIAPPGTDFDPTSLNAIVLTDPDMDGRYTGSVTGVPSGTFEYKIVMDNTFGAAAFGNAGLSSGGSNLSFTSTGTGDTINFTLDAIKGRAKAENAVVIAPGFYAQSSAWSTGYSAAEEMGTPTGGVYEKVFSVATAGDYSVRVRDENTAALPDTGNIPFTTTASPQDVVVIYDTNTYADGYQPAGNFVLILDEATRTPLYDLSYVQVVGQFQGDFLGGGAFNAGDTNFEMTETAAGSYLYTFTSPNTIAATGSGDQYKAVAQRVGSTDTGFNFQLGGALDNITITGNNASATNMTYTTGQPLSFKLDAATGRILGVAGSTLPADPIRGSYLGLSGNVSDWSQY